jgi:hypothetical protein
MVRVQSTLGEVPFLGSPRRARGRLSFYPERSRRMGTQKMNRIIIAQRYIFLEMFWTHVI